MVPARDVRDDGQPESPRREEERDGGGRLCVREDETGAFAPHRLEQPPGDVPPRIEEPALHGTLDRRPVREAAVAVRVEHPVRMPGMHPLLVKPVAVVQTDRQRVIAELPVEQGVDPGERAVGKPAARRERVAVDQGEPRHEAGPLRRRIPRHEEDGRHLPIQPLPKRAHDPRAEEDTDREQIGEDDPGLLRHRAGTPARAPIRAASESPSRPWNRSASSGVPHAGQPSTPKTVTARPPRAARRRSPSPPTDA